MDNASDKRPERRRYIRYQYPLAQRPLLEIAGWLFTVLDICEHGLRIQTSKDGALVLGAAVDMVIRFSDREVLELSGTIVRMQGPYASIFLSKAIPQARIPV